MQLCIDYSECHSLLSEIKVGKKSKYSIFMFSKDDKRLNVHKIGESEENLDDLIDSLPENDVCYCIYQFGFEIEDGSRRSRTILLSWIPKKSPPKHKMLLAGARSGFKSLIPGVIVEFIASERSEITEEGFRSECLRNIH